MIAIANGPQKTLRVSGIIARMAVAAVRITGRARRTADSILALDARLDPDEACGAAPINGLLSVARRRAMAVELIDLRNSGDTAGDRDRVVGYGAFAFREAAGARSHGRA